MPGNLSDFETLDLLGKGTFGSVYRVRRKSDGQVFVWKQLHYGAMDEREKQLVVQEVNLLQRMSHPHIVRYVDRIVDKSAATLYIIMEYCEGGDLARMIRKCKKEGASIAEEVIWRTLAQLTMALAECHHRKEGVVLHRDIKPGNVFLDRAQNVKLGDFGLARVLGENSAFARTFVGTPYYMSPEQVNGLPYNEKCDIWALGCLVHELASLSPPFEAATKTQLEQRIRTGSYPRIPSRYSSELQAAINMMLAYDRTRRATIDDVMRLRNVAIRMKEIRTAHHTVTLKNKEEGLQRREEAIRNAEDALAKREKALAQREATLTQREGDVTARERELERREIALEARERLTRLDRHAGMPQRTISSTEVAPRYAKDGLFAVNKENMYRLNTVPHSALFYP
eukprot:m51a1_g6436 putative serine threonine-protein kinase nek2 (398) ;mRNA; f:368314-370165